MTVRGRAYAHDACAACHRKSGGFVGKPGGIAVQRSFIKIGDAKRVGQIRHDGFRKPVGAFAHQPAIRAEHEHGVDRETRHTYVAATIGREFESTKELTKKEAHDVIEALMAEDAFEAAP